MKILSVITHHHVVPTCFFWFFM